MKDFARDFYASPAWRSTRLAYMKSVGGLCERCFSKGLIRSGEIVHHKIHLTPENINDEDITLAWDNLELVCRDCHAEEHSRHKRRYKVDEFGVVTTPPVEKNFTMSK